MSEPAWIFAGLCVTSTFSAWNTYQGRTIHKLVNSQFSQAKAEISEAKLEIAALRAVLAELTGKTEDKVRAAVASEQLRAVPDLPKDKA